MKNTAATFILLFIITHWGTTGFAQTNVVSFDAFGLFFNQRLGISAERSIKEKFSARLSYENIIHGTGYSNGHMVYSIHGQSLLPEFRYYPLRKKRPAPLGLFMGAYCRYGSVAESYTPENIKFRGKVLNYGIMTGYKLNHSRCIVEFLAGYGSGTVFGLDNPDRSKAGFFAQDTHEILKEHLRFEISFGLYFPRLRE